MACLRSLRCLSRRASAQRGRALVAIALLLVVLGVAAFLGARWYVYQRPLPMSADRIEFRVPPGTGVRGIAQLARAGAQERDLAHAAGGLRRLGLSGRAVGGQGVEVDPDVFAAAHDKTWLQKSPTLIPHSNLTVHFGRAEHGFRPRRSGNGQNATTEG